MKVKRKRNLREEIAVFRGGREKRKQRTNEQTNKQNPREKQSRDKDSSGDGWGGVGEVLSFKFGRGVRSCERTRKLLYTGARCHQRIPLFRATISGLPAICSLRGEYAVFFFLAVSDSAAGRRDTRDFRGFLPSRPTLFSRDCFRRVK